MTIVATLNEGQAAAADKFFSFLLGPDPEFIISGPGGVGKTHLMSYLIDQVMPRYYAACRLLDVPVEFDEVDMTATTNKAAEVLAVATQRPTSTIHSYLGLKVKDDFKTGQSTLTETANWRVRDRTILFIDEASMIDGQLLHYIRAGMHKCKVIYVGDHCQLAPVMEAISPVYRDEKPFVQLLQPMRSSVPELLAVQAQLRETVETGIFNPIKITPGVIDLLDDTQMQAEIANHFMVQTLDTRILAYTNGRVMQYNDHIRDLRQLPTEYTVGEFLVNNSAIQMKQRMLTVEEEFTIVSQDKTIIDIPIEDGVAMKVRGYTLESRIGETFENVMIPCDRPHFEALLRYYKSRGKATKSWHQYYALKNKYPDLRQRDAATVHKSQGSTYESVFIDLTNISTCHQPNAVARMLYVAFTRPRTRIFLYGELAPKYGGLIL